jgi:WD40 repeat protein
LKQEAIWAIRRCRGSDQINRLWQIWEESRDAEIARVLLSIGRAATSPPYLTLLSNLKLGKRKRDYSLFAHLVRACTDADPSIAKLAEFLAADLCEQSMLNCTEYCRPDCCHAKFLEAAVAAPYAPRDPKIRALFLFLTEQWDRYEELDLDHALLRKAYPGGPPGYHKLRTLIDEKARNFGRTAWIDVRQGNYKYREDWAIAVDVLSQSRQWDKAWRWAQGAPLIWAAQLVQRIKAASDGWSPDEESEQARFGELALKAVALGDVAPSLPESVECRLSEDTQRRHFQGHRFGRWLDGLCFSQDGATLTAMFRGLRLQWRLPGQSELGSRQPVAEETVPPGFSDGCFPAELAGMTLNLGRGHGFFPSQDLGLSGWEEDKYEWITCIAVGPDCRTIACASSTPGWSGSRVPPKLRMVSLSDGKIHREFTKIRNGVEAGGGVESLTISGDGKKLAGYSSGATRENPHGGQGIYVWDVADGRCQFLADGCGKVMALNPDGRYLACLVYRGGNGDRSSDVEIWDVENARLKKSFPNVSSGISCLAFSPDSEVVAAGVAAGCVYLLSVSGDGNFGQVLPWGNCIFGLEPNVIRVAFSRDGQALGAVDTCGGVRVWNLNAARLNILRERPVLSHLQQYSENAWQFGKGPVVREDLEWIRAAMRSGDLSQTERLWLGFAEKLISPQLERLARLSPALRRQKAKELQHQHFSHKGDLNLSDYTGGHYTPETSGTSSYIADGQGGTGGF